ncbi:hypothetical protein PIB30_026032 [Stylosanthes scabra]|uniref:Uncharacterized protein n=1 Tax=Stylosanthes scabra TaxID=79078 RepID=A0ABU6X8F7_9FABA|nr:hypothetical protein [Stylosanthes scabra]
MESTFLINSSSPYFHGYNSRSSNNNGRKIGKSSVMACWNNNNNNNYYHGGRLVDESMIVLRKRIHEMKMIERNYEAPSDWMDWEKRYYTSYDSMVLEAMAFLQTQLMNTRPSFALGAMAFLALSLPTSTALLFFHLLHFTNSLISSGIH